MCSLSFGQSKHTRYGTIITVFINMMHFKFEMLKIRGACASLLPNRKSITSEDACLPSGQQEGPTTAVTTRKTGGVLGLRPPLFFPPALTLRPQLRAAIPHNQRLLKLLSAPLQLLVLHLKLISSSPPLLVHLRCSC